MFNNSSTEDASEHRPLRRSARLSQKYNFNQQTACISKSQEALYMPLKVSRYVQTTSENFCTVLQNYCQTKSNFPNQMNDSDYLVEDNTNNGVLLNRTTNYIQATENSPQISHIMENTMSQIHLRSKDATVKYDNIGVNTRSNERHMRSISQTDSNCGGKAQAKPIDRAPKKKSTTRRKLTITKLMKTKSTRKTLSKKAPTISELLKNNCEISYRRTRRNHVNFRNYGERLQDFKAPPKKSISSIICSCHNLEQNCQNSILPTRYPSHFQKQLPPEPVKNESDVEENQQYWRQQKLDRTIVTSNCSSSASSGSPSLPESLRGIFYTDDIHELLNVERVSYRLRATHVKTLALLLNVDVNYLHFILDKLVNLSSNVLDKIETTIESQLVTNESGSENLFSDNDAASSDVIDMSPRLDTPRYLSGQPKN